MRVVPAEGVELRYHFAAVFAFCILPFRGRDCLFLFLSLFSGMEARGSFEGNTAAVGVDLDHDSCFW